MAIIGIVGFKGSGKDTVGGFLQEKYGYTRDSFAGPLKDTVAAIFGWPRHLLEGDTKDSREWRERPDEWWEQRLDWTNHPGSALSARLTPRVVLQLFGTEVLRKSFHDDIWIASMQYRLRGTNNVVITDCRFPNEIKAIRDNGGLILRVKRGIEPVWYNTAVRANSFDSDAARAEMLSSGVHVSEWAWIGQVFDRQFENDSSIADLLELVDQFLKERGL